MESREILASQRGSGHLVNLEEQLMVEIMEPTSLTDSLSAAMRRQIIGGKLQPGTKLTEGWVAETFAVARPTAKAALDRLNNEGLLRRGARRSSVIPLLTADDVSDIYLNRKIIELKAVAMLAAQSEQPDAARKALRSMQQAAEDDDFMEHVEADISFHRALVKAVGSVRMVRMHETIMGEAQLCIAQVQARRLTHLGDIAREHAAIIEAIAIGDVKAAKSALSADLNDARDRLLVGLRAPVDSLDSTKELID
jgi:DNA-binding GntR family transcriptional regulator